MFKVRRETVMLIGWVITVLIVLVLAAKIVSMESYIENIEDRLDTLEDYYIDSMRTNIEHAKSKKRYDI